MTDFRNKLKKIIEERNTTKERAFDWCIQGLILISVVSFSIETLPNLPHQLSHFLILLGFVIGLIFVIEYIARIWVADSKRDYIFSFYGIIDLIAVLPFILALGIDLRSLRIFRFLRLFRILKLGRYNKAISRILSALRLAKEELIIFTISALFILYLSAVGIYYFENEAQPEHFQSVFHSLWWSVSTLTTVGYGDVYPITFGGKVFTFFVLIIGLGIVAVPAGVFASALSATRKKDNIENIDSN